MPPIVIATTDDHLVLDRSDALFRDALVRLGADVHVASWRGAGMWTAVGAGDALVVRSVWDYPEHPAAFADWLERLSRLDKPVLNPPALMRWNADKTYLLDLGRRGVPTPRTAAVRSADELAAAFDAIQGDTGVIKPCVGGSGRDVEKVDLAGAQAYLNRNAADGRRFLLQEMLPEIAAGELSFVFIGGRHTHTVRSRPASGDFRVNSQYGPSDIALFHAPADLVAQAASVVSLLPSPPTYARIDGVVRDGRFVCLEAEVIDPTLFLHLHPPAAERLAEAVLAEVA